jgi:hypothetical protein
VIERAWRLDRDSRGRRQKHIQILILNEFHNVTVDAFLKKLLAFSRA